MRQSTKIHSTTRGFHAFLPCRAAAVVQDPPLRSRDDPPAPEVDLVAVAADEQAAIPERRQPCARETPRTRRARERPAQDLEDPAETPLLPLESRGGSPRGTVRTT